MDGKVKRYTVVTAVDMGYIVVLLFTAEIVYRI